MTSISTNNEDFINTLVQFCHSQSGLLFIRGYQNHPRPQKSNTYGTVTPLFSRQIGITERRYEVANSTQLMEYLKETYTSYVRLTVYSANNVTNTFDILQKLRLQLRSSYATEYLGIAGIGFVSCDTPKELYPELEFGIKKRTQATALFNVTAETNNLVDSVAGVEVSEYISRYGNSPDLLTKKLTMGN